jgi:DNA polymerase III sliding clamp (beta) subunit (PCNA family)
MKLKTEVMKELVAKVSVGIGGNKLIPITELLGIKVADGVLTLETTDVNNYVFAISKVDGVEDFEAVVYAEKFSKLVGKLTSEYVELNLVDGNLVVTGNGTYTIDLPLDENGSMIQYPDPRVSADDETEYNITIEDICTAIQIAKPSLATTLERPVLTNYYVGDSLFATNGITVTEYKKKFTEKPILVSAKLMDIIGSITDKTAKMFVSKGYIRVEADGFVVHSIVADSADEYATEAVQKFVSTEFSNCCKVRKADIMLAIDRIALFVDKYDNSAIRLVFDKDAVVVSNVKSGSSESVEYTEHKGSKKKFEPTEVYINSQMLLEQLKAFIGEVVTINYGTDFAISLSSENTIQIVSLMEV